MALGATHENTISRLPTSNKLHLKSVVLIALQLQDLLSPLSQLTPTIALKFCASSRADILILSRYPYLLPNVIGAMLALMSLPMVYFFLTETMQSDASKQRWECVVGPGCSERIHQFLACGICVGGCTRVARTPSVGIKCGGEGCHGARTPNVGLSNRQHSAFVAPAKDAISRSKICAHRMGHCMQDTTLTLGGKHCPMGNDVTTPAELKGTTVYGIMLCSMPLRFCGVVAVFCLCVALALPAPELNRPQKIMPQGKSSTRLCTVGQKRLGAEVITIVVDVHHLTSTTKWQAQHFKRRPVTTFRRGLNTTALSSLGRANLVQGLVVPCTARKC